jgi:hypothetical protein
MRLLRNVFLRAPDIRSIACSGTPQASIYTYKDWLPTIFQVTIPIDRKSITDAIDYDVVTCHFTGTLTVIAKRRNNTHDIDERICNGLGIGDGCELR